MGDLPDDPQARQEWLERWAAEHRWRDESPRRIPWRSREGLARAPAALLKSAMPILVAPLLVVPLLFRVWRKNPKR